MANMIMFSICRYQLKSNDDGNKGRQETNSQKSQTRIYAFILSMGELH